MTDRKKTKEQLLVEIGRLRRRLDRLEKKRGPSVKPAPGKPAPGKLGEALEKVRTLDAIAEHVLYQEPNGRIIWANRAAADSLGKKPEDIRGRYCFELWGGRKKPCVGCPVQRARRLGKPQEGEIVSKDGRVWLIRGYPMKNERGKVTAMAEVALEVTTERRTIEALKESEELYKSLVRTLPDSITVSDLSGKITHVSERSLEFYGTKNPDDMIGRSAFELIGPEHRERAMANLQRTLKEGRVENMEYELSRKDGSTYIGELNASIVRDAYGKPRAFIAAIRDVTERKRVEEALRESEARYKALFDRSINCIYVHDLEGNFIDANDATLKLLGYTSREIRKLKLRDLLDPDQLNEAAATVSEIVSRGFQRRFSEFRLRKKDGTYVYIEAEGTLLYREGRPFAVQGTARDITDSRLARQALAEEKELLAVTLRSIAEGVITTDMDGSVVLLNKVAETLTGFSQEEAEGKPLEEVFRVVEEVTRKPAPSPASRVLRTGGIVAIPERTVLVARDGTERIIADSGAPITDMESRVIGVVIVFSDITEKRRMEDELQRAQKLESIGILAGGIAHDFNNILTAVIGNLSLAKINIKPEDEIYDRLHEAGKAASIAKDLTQQLLTFSKGGAPIKKVASVKELLADTTEFALSGSNVRCRYDIPENLWSVECDVGQIAQVINNLIINAKQSMPAGGTVDLSARNVVIGKRDRLPLADGKYLKIAVTDRGIGIPQEHLPLIFDPYFTTKQRGSGLGLATTYSIVKNHGGYIRVESKEGSGTCFEVFLPSTGKVMMPPRKISRGLRSGRGRILLMDDEEVVRKVAQTLLKYLGYDVAIAEDGETMVELYRKARSQGRPFDAVILDLTIPGGMGGKEAVRKLQEIDKKVKAIVSSGYSNDPIMANYRKYGFKGVVAKPYEIDDLGVTLQKVLSEED